MRPRYPVFGHREVEKMQKEQAMRCTKERGYGFSACGRQGYTSLDLKLLAMLVMVFDHTITLLLPHCPLKDICRVPGGICAPLMCFLTAQGYRYTKSRLRYLRRLLAFSVLSHLPYVLCFDYALTEATSVLWSLSMGLVALMAVRDGGNVPMWARVLMVLCACCLAVPANWNYIGVLWVVGFGCFPEDRRRGLLFFFSVSVFLWILPGVLRYGSDHWYRVGVLLAAYPISRYNGEKGYASRAVQGLFYWFYPLHLLLLFLIFRVL